MSGISSIGPGMDTESRALASVEEEPATAAASGADRPRRAVQEGEVHDFDADPEVQDFDGSLIQAIDEGIVEKPPLRPFRESAQDKFEGLPELVAVAPR